MKIEVEGILTAGYYNDMEAGHPVFINGASLSDVVKDKLQDMGMDGEFCWAPFGGPDNVKNPLIGKRVKLTLEVFD